MNSDGNPSTKLQSIEKAMTSAAETALVTDGRRRPGWFEATLTVLNTAINTRNQASSAYFKHLANEL
jgi:adenylosuccinate synthase